MRTEKIDDRDDYGALKAVPAWVRDLTTACERSGAWTTGIESDSKKRGSAINTSEYGYDEKALLAVVQVRECVFHPRRFNRVRKDYYLCGYTEQGRPFAHSVSASVRLGHATKTITGAVERALCEIWGCDVEDLPYVIRNGDVAFVPVAKIPDNAVPVEGNHVIIRDTHHVKATRGEILTTGKSIYLRGSASISHSKNQHPKVKASGTWRVVAGNRAEHWGFSAPTAD